MLRLIAQEDCPIPALAAAARTDAAFSAEILRFANSVIVGSRFEIVSILHAISSMGLERLRSLVITIALRNIVRSAKANKLLRSSWQHNFACALACEWMADACEISRAAAYSSGLLHELGRISMIALFREEYLKVADEAARSGKDLEALERQTFGIDHFDAGKMLSDEWRLPGVLADAISHRRPSPDEPFGISHLVSVGCAIADQSGFSLSGAQAEWDPAIVGAILPVSALERLVPRLAELKDEIPFKVRTFESEFLSK
jgi:HD-like signal output (HDOD) protein